MTRHAVNRMIQRRAGQAGSTPPQIALLGGHSLRAGFVTEAFRAGADAHAIMRQTGQQSPGMPRGLRPRERPVDGQRSDPHRALRCPPPTITCRRLCRRRRSGLTRGLGVVHGLMRRHRSPAVLPADSGTVAGFLSDKPGRDAAATDRGDQSPAHRDRFGATRIRRRRHHPDRHGQPSAVRAMRDHPMAPGPRRGDDQTQPPRPGKADRRRRPGHGPVTAPVPINPATVAAHP